MNFEIGDLTINIPDFQSHETPEYIVKRVERMLTEAVEEVMAEDRAMTRLTEQYKTSKKANNLTPTYSGSPTNKVTESGATNINTPVTGGATAADSFGGMGKSTIKPAKTASIAPITSNPLTMASDDPNDPIIREKLIEYLNQQLFALNSKPTTFTTTPQNKELSYAEIPKDKDLHKEQNRLYTIIDRLKDKTISLATLFKEYPELITYYKEIVPQIVQKLPYPDTNQMRKKLVDKIDSLFINTKDEEGKVIKKPKETVDYWRYIIQQLNNSDITLATLFETHNELFYLLDSITETPEFVSLSELIKMEINILSDFTKVYNYNITQEQIYAKLNAYKDITGKGVFNNMLTADKLEVLQIPGETINFCIEEKNTPQTAGYRNWIIHQLIDGQWKEIEIHVDKGNAFSTTFKNKGIYVVEAYGKSYSSKYSKKTDRIKKRINGKFPYFYYVIKDPELKEIQSEITSHIRKGKQVYQFNPVADVKDKSSKLTGINWQVHYSTTSAKEGYACNEYFENKKCINIPFTKEGWYKIEAITVDSKVTSKPIMVGGNWVTRIQATKNKSFMLYNTADAITYKAVDYKLKTIAEDLKDICWKVLYDNKVIYAPEGVDTMTWGEQKAKEGTYTVQAYTNTGIFGVQGTHETFSIIHPIVTNAFWGDANGNRKEFTGFGGEESYICATIGYYYDKEVYIEIYSEGEKINPKTIITKTNSKGEVSYKFVLDATYQAMVADGQTLHFKIKGINYILKEENRELSKDGLMIASNKQITDTYFSYLNKKIDPKKYSVPVETILQVNVQTVNLIGTELRVCIFKINKVESTSSSQVFTKNITVKKDGSIMIDFPLKKYIIDENRYFYIEVLDIEGKLLTENIDVNNRVVFTFKDGDFLPDGLKIYTTSIDPWPVRETHNGFKRRLGSGYGPRNIKGRPEATKFHRGLDINFGSKYDDFGASVIATHDGIIIEAKDTTSGSGGRTITIESENGIFQTRYNHLSVIFVKIKQKVRKGQIIGEVGASAWGDEKGSDSHLHYAIKKLNSQGKMEWYNPTEGKRNLGENIVDPQKWI